MGDINPTGERDCVACTEDLLARLRGEDPPPDPAQSVDDLRERYGGTLELVGFHPLDAIEEITRQLRDAGEGAQGFVFAHLPEPTPGHVFAAVYRNGDIRFPDARHGVPAEWFGRGYDGFAFMRVPGTGRSDHGDDRGDDPDEPGEPGGRPTAPGGGPPDGPATPAADPEGSSGGPGDDGPSRPRGPRDPGDPDDRAAGRGVGGADQHSLALPDDHGYDDPRELRDLPEFQPDDRWADVPDDRVVDDPLELRDAPEFQSDGAWPDAAEGRYVGDPEGRDDASAGSADGSVDHVAHLRIDGDALRRLLDSSREHRPSYGDVDAPEHREVDNPYRVLNGPRFPLGGHPHQGPPLTDDALEDWFHELEARGDVASEEEYRRVEAEARSALESLLCENSAHFERLDPDLRARLAQLAQDLGVDPPRVDGPLAQADIPSAAGGFRPLDPERYGWVADVNPHGLLTPGEAANAVLLRLADEMRDLYPNGRESFVEWQFRLHSMRMARLETTGESSLGLVRYEGYTPSEARVLIRQRLDAGGRGTMARIICQRADGPDDVFVAVVNENDGVDFVNGHADGPGVFTGEGYTHFLYEEYPRPPRPAE